MPEFDDFRARFGQIPRTELVKRDGGHFVGVFIMSRVGEAKTLIGTTSSPHDIAKQLHRFSWEETQCDLVAWTEDRLIAKRLLKIVENGLRPVHHRDSWYAIEGERAAAITLWLAKEANITVFGDEERRERLENDISDAVRRVKGRMDGSKQLTALPPAAGAEESNVVILPPRRGK
jgi:hypothetical protein